MGGLLYLSSIRTQVVERSSRNTEECVLLFGALVAFKQASWVINKQHMNVLFGSTHGQQLWYDVPLHVQKLVWVGTLEYVLFLYAAICLFVVDMQTNAIMRWTQAFAVAHVY